MTRQTHAARDLVARDIYERAMKPYWDLQAEADRERLLKQIPVTGKTRPALFKTLLAGCGSGLISFGSWLQSLGKREPIRDDYYLPEIEDY